MKITTPLNELVIVSLTPAEAAMLAKAVSHTRREYFCTTERIALAGLANSLDSCLISVIQIKRPAVTALA